MLELLSQNVVHFGWFVVAGVLLNLTPGPDVLYILSHAMRRGAHAFKAGVWASLGIITGCVVHVSVAALGLGALLAASAQAFAVVKWVGAAYLVYLGIKSWRSSQRSSTVVATGLPDVPHMGKVFMQGVLTNVLNPKVVLFFLAFLPQFVAPSAPQPSIAFWVLGLVFCLNSLLFCLMVARSGVWLGHCLMARPQIGRWMDRIAGTMFVGFGVRLALAQPPQS